MATILYDKSGSRVMVKESKKVMRMLEAGYTVEFPAPESAPVTDEEVTDEKVTEEKPKRTRRKRS